MSPKKRILRELVLVGETGTEYAFVRPSDIPGWGDAPERYQRAVNELLRDRLIEGRTDGEGRMSISLNSHRVRDVRKQIRPIWAHPAVWAVLVVVLAIGAALAT